MQLQAWLCSCTQLYRRHQPLLPTTAAHQQQRVAAATGGEFISVSLETAGNHRAARVWPMLLPF